MTEITLKSTIDVDLIQFTGSDMMIAHAAMVSTKGVAYSGGTPISQEKMTGLLRSLINNRHGTPFEHGSMTVRVHAPIKVWREWHRHRIGWSYNEESGRYKQLDPIFWMPPIERKMIRPEEFKSMRPEFDHATEEEYTAIKRELLCGYQESYNRYERLLAMQVDRGLARDILGVGIYSACYCTASPRSIMAFLELRTNVPTSKRPSHPLWEIAEAARQLEAIFAANWPVTHHLWNENGRMAP
jgi:thymidylate synthase (FAD)